MNPFVERCDKISRMDHEPTQTVGTFAGTQGKDFVLLLQTQGVSWRCSRGACRRVVKKRKGGVSLFGMREITNPEQIRELLSKYEFNMINKANNWQGEVTTLDKNDIDSIVGDMALGTLAPKVYLDLSDQVIVEYPNNVCRLESGKERFYDKRSEEDE